MSRLNHALPLPCLRQGIHKTLFSRGAISIFMLAVAFCSRAGAQTCPDSPQSYSHGNLTVLEGQLAGAEFWERGMEAAVAFDRQDPAHFVATWVSARSGLDQNFRTHSFVMAAAFAGATDSSPGSCIHAPEVLSGKCGLPFYTWNYLPSIAVNSDSDVMIAFSGRCDSSPLEESDSSGIVRIVRVFNRTDSDWPDVSAGGAASNYRPSVGLADVSPPVNAIVYAKTLGTNTGIMYSKDGHETLSGVLETCVPYCAFRWQQWNPAVAVHQPTGYWIAVWGAAEGPGLIPHFDVKLQILKPDGSKAHSTPVTVNDLDMELPDRDQWWPSVDIDDNGNIIVSWWGAVLSGCGSDRDFVYARRLHWDGTDSAPVFVGSPFIVNNNPDFIVAAETGGSFPMLPNPVVSIDKSGSGRFIVAWNAAAASATAHEIHAQYFEFNAVGISPRTLGAEFRVNQQNDQPESPEWRHRRISNPAQHTLAYGPGDQAVCAWSVIQTNDGLAKGGNEKVYFTLLPPQFGDYQAELVGCDCPGDMNEDGLRDGRDIQPFITAFLTLAPANGPPTCDALAT